MDPAERLTAAAALEQLPGKDKVVYPTLTLSPSPQPYPNPNPNKVVYPTDWP